MALGKHVKELRDLKGWDQGELASRAKIDRTLVSRIESGHTPNPGVRVLKGLARALGCSIDYLVDLYGEDHTPSSSSATVSA